MTDVIRENEYSLDNRDLRTTELHAIGVTIVVDPVELLENAIENSDPSEEVLQTMSALWRLLGIKPEESSGPALDALEAAYLQGLADAREDTRRQQNEESSE